MRTSRFTIIVTVLLGLTAQLLILFSTPPSADACSFAPPQLEVSPTDDLRPGDTIKVRGDGFIDLVFHPVEPEYDPITGEELPQHSCAGIEVIDKVVVLSWVDADGETPIQRVMGPSFELALTVPDRAMPGWAGLQADWVIVDLTVGPAHVEPCPLHGAVSPSADCPCPLHGAVAPSADCPWPCIELPVEERPAPPCVEPCPVYAHDAPGKVPDHCPNPCGDLEADLVWCPPPCDVFILADRDALAEAPGDCPEPCPVHLDGAVATGAAQVAPAGCPDPCGAVDVAAVWCPPPCPVQLDAAAGSRVAQVLPPGCPDPCAHGGAPNVRCADPCIVDPNGHDCPMPCPADDPARPQVSDACVDPCAWMPDVEPAAEPHAAIGCAPPCRPLDDGSFVCVEPHEPQPLPETTIAPSGPGCTHGPDGSRCSDPTDDATAIRADTHHVAVGAVEPAATVQPAAPNIAFVVCDGDGVACAEGVAERSLAVMRRLLDRLPWPML